MCFYDLLRSNLKMLEIELLLLFSVFLRCFLEICFYGYKEDLIREKFYVLGK